MYMFRSSVCVRARREYRGIDPARSRRGVRKESPRNLAPTSSRPRGDENLRLLRALKILISRDLFMAHTRAFESLTVDRTMFCRASRHENRTSLRVSPLASHKAVFRIGSPSTTHLIAPEVLPEQISDTSRLQSSATMLGQCSSMFYSEVKPCSQRLMELQNQALVQMQ